MLTDADRAIWRQFLATVDTHRARLEADDMVPLAMIFTRVTRRHDDGALVDTADVTLCSPDVDPAMLRRALTAALATLETA